MNHKAKPLLKSRLDVKNFFIGMRLCRIWKSRFPIGFSDLDLGPNDIVPHHSVGQPSPGHSIMNYVLFICYSTFFST